MWIRVAKHQSAIKIGQAGNRYIDGPLIEEFYFDEAVAEALDADQFLLEMWEKLQAMFDWGDCDYFEADRCKKLYTWVSERLCKDISPAIRPVYEVMQEYSALAVRLNTGMYFDF